MSDLVQELEMTADSIRMVEAGPDMREVQPVVQTVLHAGNKVPA